MNKRICLSIIVLEGAALLSFEILASRLYTPFLGSALHVWTSILTMTLLALAFGYYAGGRVKHKQIQRYLIAGLFAASVFVLISPYTATFVLTQSIDLSIEMASIVAGACIILPPIFLLGLVSPMVTKYISDDLGKNAGLVFGVGTLSGVISTLLFVHLIIPRIGVRNSITFIACIVFIAALLTLLLRRTYEHK